MNVSRKVLHRHYDNRSAEVKLEHRWGYLNNIRLLHSQFDVVYFTDNGNLIY